MNIQENIKRILREETNIKPALHDLLNMLFDGFDDMYYDWAEYNWKESFLNLINDKFGCRAWDLIIY